MQTFNTDLRQAIKWMHNKAPQIQKLIMSKAEWYERYNNYFWENWERDVFNLDTVNEFGVYVWCEILGIPKSKFVFEPLTNAWAYGPERQNYKYSGVGAAVNIPAADRNLIGGNFFGSGDDVVSSLIEARIILKLRYATLISDGRIPSINYILKYIISPNAEWDYFANKYFYVIDDSSSRIVQDTDLIFTVQDWQGTYNLSAAARIQIGHYNLNMKPLGVAADKWIFNIVLNAGSGPGTSTPVPAPDGSLNSAYKSQFPTTYTQNNMQLMPRAQVNPPKIMPSAPRQVYIQSFFVQIDRSASGLKRFRIQGAGLSTGYDPASYWFVNQDVDFNFDNGDPIFTVRPAGFQAAYPYPTDRRYAGWEKYPNDWYRIWNVSITSNTHPNAVGGLEIKNQLDMGTGIGAFPFETNLASKIVTAWGAMVEQRPDDGSIPVPGKFFYTANNRGTQKLQVDYFLDLNNNTITLATSDAGGSILLNGAKMYLSGKWQGFNIDPPYLFATGDGNTRQFALSAPPGFQPEYNKPARMEYRIGRGFTFSPQFINLVSDRSLGILPANAGIPYDVVY